MEVVMFIDRGGLTLHYNDIYAPLSQALYTTITVF